jgi:HAD superfamily hydrolase (TIGR01509 family)
LIRLLTIDCWGTVLQTDSAWDDRLIDFALSEFRNSTPSITRQTVVDAFNAEGADFSRILRDEKVTLVLAARLKAFASYAQVKLFDGELNRLRANFEGAIFDPLPEPFPGVREFLLKVKQRDLRTCVICNTGWFSSRAINGALTKCDLAQFFDFYAYSDVIGSAKPSPKIFEFALSAAGARPEETIHIGDKVSTDIVGALDAGLGAIHFHTTGGGCTYKTVPCASSYEEIWAILSSYLTHSEGLHRGENADSR